MRTNASQALVCQGQGAPSNPGSRTNALSPDQVSKLLWDKERQPDFHTLRIGVKPEYLFVKNPVGEWTAVAAIINHDYHFFWSHLHVHIARKGECGLTKKGLAHHKVKDPYAR